MIMKCKDYIAAYLTTLKGDFQCRETEGRLWVISPYALPDGDLVEVVVSESLGDRAKVTDLGETLRHLLNWGYDPRTTTKGRYLLGDILKRFNVQIENGQIQKRTAKSEIGQAMFDVISACVATSELIYMSRAYQPAKFVEEVSRYLDSHGVMYEPGTEVTGSTGKTYKVDFFFPRVDSKQGMLEALSPGGLGAVSRIVDHTVRMWLDIGNKKKWRGTLLDDREIEWKKVDIKILEKESDVYFWQQRRSMLAILQLT